jgi:dephospho-CoA kinase
MSRMIIIGITGTIGAGKGTMVDYLVKEKGFKHFSVRAFLLEEIARRGLEPIRDTMSMVGDDLRKKHFPGYIVSELLKQAEAYGKNSVIESIRSVGEVETLKEKSQQFYLFAVDADLKLRYKRAIARNLSTDNVTFEKFVEDEEKEFNQKETWRMNIKACMEKADYIFQNNGTVQELYQKVEKILEKIEK